MRPEPRVERNLDVEAPLRPSIGRVGGAAALRGTAGARSAASYVPKTGKTRPHSVSREVGVVMAGRAQRAGVVMAGRAQRARPQRVACASRASTTWAEIGITSFSRSWTLGSRGGGSERPSIS